MPKKIAYLGPPGTFSEEAVLAYDASAQGVPCPSVAAAIATVEAGKADEAMAPIENSIEGSVTDTLDLMIHVTKLKIRMELVLPVTQCLMAARNMPLDEIKVVYSHPQPLAQCRRFLEAKLPQAQAVASLSTVQAVADMKAHKGSPAAAIAPRRAAQLYGATLLAEGIQDHAHNVTRFVVLAREDHAPTGDDKTSIAFSFAEDKPKQIYLAVKEFADRGINLSKIESRPAKEGLGKYFFLLDFDRHRLDPVAVDALANLRRLAQMLIVFGSYPRYRAR